MAEENDDFDSISRFLGSLDNYVILRNHDFRANLGNGGDIDILVADGTEARKRLRQSLGRPWWTMRRSYVHGFFYPWGHIDLLPRVEWRGACYLENETILASAERSAIGFQKPRLAHEALISWFASLIWGGFFKARYAEVIVDAARNDGKAFRESLTHALGNPWGEKLFELAVQATPERSVDWVKPLRRALWWRSFARSPLRTTVGCLHFWWRETALRLVPPLPWVAILGPDGSGKSTIIEGLRGQWSQMGMKSAASHWRPEWLRPAPPQSGPVTDPHGKPPRGMIASLVKLALLFLDWTFGFRVVLAHQRAKGVLVVFDRCFHDLLADPRRYRFGAPLWLAECCNLFLPKPDALILLDAPAEVVHARKPETTIETARMLRDRYLKVVRRYPYGQVVNCDQSVTQVVDDVVDLVRRVVAARRS